MTRKRFIRLVMARRVGRNDAQEIAKGVHNHGLDYWTGYCLVRRGLDIWEHMQCNKGVRLFVDFSD